LDWAILSLLQHNHGRVARGIVVSTDISKHNLTGESCRSQFVSSFRALTGRVLIVHRPIPSLQRLYPLPSYVVVCTETHIMPITLRRRNMTSYRVAQSYFMITSWGSRSTDPGSRVDNGKIRLLNYSRTESKHSHKRFDNLVVANVIVRTGIYRDMITLLMNYVC
jgi:hypothetical protein